MKYLAYGTIVFASILMMLFGAAETANEDLNMSDGVTTNSNNMTLTDEEILALNNLTTCNSTPEITRNETANRYTIKCQNKAGGYSTWSGSLSRIPEAQEDKPIGSSPSMPANMSIPDNTSESS